MTLSVLMSVYKSERPEYLDRSLQSIISDQTEKPDMVVLVQDGFLDNDLLRVIKKWREIVGDKMVIIKNETNLGLTKSLNEGLDVITTDLVARMDSDDISCPERFEKQMRAKSIIQEEIEEKGGFVVEELAEKIFEEQPELKVAFQDKMEKYDMVKEEIQPHSENTVRKYQSQHLYTDTGIEIKIPMDQYKNHRSVEFITNPDGTVSVLIKNIEHLEAKL